ncbi:MULTISPECIES: molybdopterin-guanine dinucleotide biosynthesis protein B [Methanoculleus]|jgi:molybdopterin synthase catalytic subunit|uniref:Molybdopterin synthase subunit MoaE /molybdopterin guanine dinucleotide biosynthesis accessory protein MobB n=1 Tax=Methanoculleus thermophilus TaxID=2200 RepID=A0A1G8Y3Y2_9EURY|nr:MULTISPECIES: molybdopterin-guanine dinucleotide biosynthesis protein B [Methanoculleus]NLN08864.1 molybdopterin-guanine dinucleotide biosynthesis protein B [Methanoculleus thermophilus]SDJ97532.1 molybdopterin synthase subunit MoaE /molybdopterin guanine dinucleotide biosynthesis accessory protein MobB [Methanoculleus thermophilus]HQD25419.1 molybdopterin-guanine dinucleotide biosynthesis protein B [Methanoculleus thermophilus]
MKIIQIVGRSNAGKTTFIKSLIPALSAHGVVGVVKHLGHHGFALEPGKDTTVYYDSHAALSCGVDDDKSVLIRRENDLDSTLEVFCNAGVDYAILEGFKSRQFPRIVIGDLASENVVLRNPTVDEVIAVLERFENYYTTEGLVKELRREHGVSHAGVILTLSEIVRERIGTEHIEDLEFDETVDALIEDIRQEMESTPGIIGARAYHRKGRLYAGDDIAYIAILSERRAEAFAAASNAIDRLKRELHDVEK